MRCNLGIEVYHVWVRLRIDETYFVVLALLTSNGLFGFKLDKKKTEFHNWISSQWCPLFRGKCLWIYKCQQLKKCSLSRDVHYWECPIFRFYCVILWTFFFGKLGQRQINLQELKIWTKAKLNPKNERKPTKMRKCNTNFTGPKLLAGHIRFG